MSTKKTGLQGETAATDYLKSVEYDILEQNYRFGSYEVDIICRDPKGILVFIEVKTKMGTHGYDPETTARSGQMQRIAHAAGEYMYDHNYEGEIRFDVVGVRLVADQKPLIQHYKDVFYPMT